MIQMELLWLLLVAGRLVVWHSERLHSCGKGCGRKRDALHGCVWMINCEVDG